MKSILEILNNLQKLKIESNLSIFQENNLSYNCTGMLNTDDFKGIIFIISGQNIKICWEVFEKVKMNPIDAKTILDNVVYLNNLLAREINSNERYIF